MIDELYPYYPHLKIVEIPRRFWRLAQHWSSLISSEVEFGREDVKSQSIVIQLTTIILAVQLCSIKVDQLTNDHDILFEVDL